MDFVTGGEVFQNQSLLFCRLHKGVGGIRVFYEIVKLSKGNVAHYQKVEEKVTELPKSVLLTSVFLMAARKSRHLKCQ